MNQMCTEVYLPVHTRVSIDILESCVTWRSVHVEQRDLSYKARAGDRKIMITTEDHKQLSRSMTCACPIKYQWIQS